MNDLFRLSPFLLYSSLVAPIAQHFRFYRFVPSRECLHFNIEVVLNLSISTN